MNLITLKHWALIVYQQHLERDSKKYGYGLPVQSDPEFKAYCYSSDASIFMQAFGDPKHELHSAIRAVCNEARATVGLPPCKPI